MRGKAANNRKTNPDEIFGSVKVAKFINYVMQKGKKSIAQKMVYQALDKLAQETKLGQIEAFERALTNVTPKIELKTRRVGGANYQVPVPVSESRQQSLSMRWIITATQSNRGKNTSSDSLFRELLNAFNKEGWAIKKRDEVHKMAESNKAFSHLTW